MLYIVHYFPALCAMIAINCTVVKKKKKHLKNYKNLVMRVPEKTC